MTTALTAALYTTSTRNVSIISPPKNIRYPAGADPPDIFCYAIMLRLCFELLICGLLAVPEDNCQICQGEHRAYYVCAGPGDVEADLRVHDERAGDESVEHAGDHRNPCILCLTVAEHPDGYAGQCKEGERLVGPCEVAPQNVEAVDVELCPDKDTGHECKDDRREAETLAVGALVNVESIGNGQTQCAQRRVAGRDGQDDNAEQGDDAADAAEYIAADDADSRRRL